MRTLYSYSGNLPVLNRELFDEFLNTGFELYLKDQKHLRPLTKKERKVFDEAVVNGYVVDTPAMKYVARAYWYYCEVNDKPNIEIRPMKNYATVRVNFITGGHRGGYTGETEQKLNKILREKYWSNINREHSWV